MSNTIALGIEYDGSHFCGWQIQPDVPTVQATLEKALAAFLNEPTSTFCAGRTDTGVHATNQVVSVITPHHRAEQNWIRGLNANLPEGVAVRWMRPVPESFNARFSAHARVYEYWIRNDPIRSPLWEKRTGWVFRALDIERMRAASECLIGTHDFTSFRASSCQAESPVRTLTRIEMIQQGPLIGIRLEANGFLHHMVRNIVGSLIYVGTGREPVSWMGEVLEAKNRDVAAPTFSPSGLYFTGVRYADCPLEPYSVSPFGWTDNGPKRL